MARGEKVAVLFAPDSAAMYPEPIHASVTVNKLTGTLCGKCRPGHFDGVSTVVAKLFNIIKPYAAVFGKKDFQQLAVIKRMVKDLNWDIDIVGHPIVREPDGLAMSSRNTYLKPEERKTALCLYNAIQLAKERAREGVKQADMVVLEIKELLTSNNDVVVDYVNIVDQDSLIEQQALDDKSWLVMAVQIGRTRLIDNAGLFEGD